MTRKIAFLAVIVSLGLLARSSNATYFPDQYKISLPIHEGWNLIPLYAWESESMVPTSGLKNSDFLYKFVFGVRNQKYYLVEKNGKPIRREIINFEVPQFASAWAYSEKEGNYEFGWGYRGFNTGKLSDIALQKGWNFTFVSPLMVGKTVDDIKGSCIFSKLYTYAREGGEVQWVDLLKNMGADEQFTDQSVGYALVVKVPAECRFGSSILPPPALPE